MTLCPGDMRQWLRLWAEAKKSPPRDILVSPLFTSPTTLALVRESFEAREQTRIFFDSGGYQVQCGRLAYHDLYRKLMSFYGANSWADYYVLPDHVPTSSDTLAQVEAKVRDTVTVAELFAHEMPGEQRSRALGVVQGQSIEQIQFCLESYARLGLRTIGFGSFPTNGAGNSTNLISRAAIELVRHIVSFCRQSGQRLHLFGLGNPPLAFVFHKLGVHSFDSMGWFKAATYGNVSLPFCRAFNVTHRNMGQASRALSWSEFEAAKDATSHACPFCRCEKTLRHSRLARAAHNLVVMEETVARLRTWDDTSILQAMQGRTQYHQLALEACSYA